MSNRFHEIAKVIEQQEICTGHYRLRLFAPRIAAAAEPGQFVHLRVSTTLEPFLRRPLSIHNVTEEGELWLFYRKAGRGTTILTTAPSGSSLDLLGPLGKGFNWNGIRRAAIIAGGVGIAPLYFLARRLKEEGKELKLFMGGKTKDLLPKGCFFHFLGVKPLLATDDGSLGWHGMITEVLTEELAKGFHPDQVFACGPRPMLKVVAALALQKGISCQVSLEEYMACGLGACLGCPVTLKNENGDYYYRQVCRDGPVFDAQEVFFDGC